MKSTAKGMKHHLREFLEDNYPGTTILHFRTSNLKNYENIKDIATDIMNLAVSVKNEKNTVVASGITGQNDKLNEKQTNVNILLKRKSKEEKMLFWKFKHYCKYVESQWIIYDWMWNYTSGQ